MKNRRSEHLHKNDLDEVLEGKAFFTDLQLAKGTWRRLGKATASTGATRRIFPEVLHQGRF